MIDWRTRLRDEVGATAAELLTPEAARSMRRTVVAAARARAREGASFPFNRALVFAATAALTIAAGIGAARRIGSGAIEQPAAQPGIPAAPTFEARPAPNRQVHFSTPGGTRMIWILNSDLELKASNP